MYTRIRIYVPPRYIYRVHNKRYYDGTAKTEKTKLTFARQRKEFRATHARIKDAFRDEK